MKIKSELVIGAAVLAILGMNIAPLKARAAEKVVSETTVITACGKLFEIDANADGLTAPQRAAIVQKNLDNAFINAKDLTPTAVRVAMENDNPIITLDHRYVVTADANSATRNGLTQKELAEKWANSIRFCLSDAKMVKDYVSMLTGKFETTAIATGATRNDVAVLTNDTLLPVHLTTPISSRGSALGDFVQAVISTDVPLGPTYSGYIPAGTVALGKIVDASVYDPSDWARKRGMTVAFYELRTPDGKTIPIDAHVLGGINSCEVIRALPQVAECCGNGLTTEAKKLVSFKVNPAKGYIVGSWKGASVGTADIADGGQGINQPTRFIFDRTGGMHLREGQALMLQPSATTAIAIAGLSL